MTSITLMGRPPFGVGPALLAGPYLTTVRQLLQEEYAHPQDWRRTCKQDIFDDLFWTADKGAGTKEMDNDPIKLYDLAASEHIDVDWFSMPQASSLSIMLPDGSCCIAIDPWKMNSVPMETVALAHELGHCCTGSFYNRWAAMDIQQKHENRADKWAVEHLIPADELDSAVASGCTDLWSLADYFGVTPDFMRKAVCWHTHGNLAADLYF